MSTPEIAASVRRSTRERLASFDADRCAEAARAGRPVERMAMQSAPRRASTAPNGGTAWFFFRRAGKLVCGTPGGDVQPATPQRIWQVLRYPGALWVPVSGEVLTSMIAMTRTAVSAATGDDIENHARTLRTLCFTEAAAVSSTMIVLSEALNRKFYAPGQAGQTGLAAWAKLLGVRIAGSDPTSGMAELLTLCWGNSATVRFERQDQDPWLTILRSEETAENACAYGGSGSNATQFGAAQAIATGWDTLLRVDPLARQRCAVTGEVTRVQIVGQKGAAFRAVASGAARTREGASIITAADTTDVAVNYLDVDGFSIADGGLELILSRAKKLPSKFSDSSDQALFDALHRKTEMYLSGAPYLAPAQTVGARHWSGREVKPEDRVSRNVPLHVMLAGA